MDSVLVLEAESFPLPLRNGGCCFLLPDDTDTPKTRQYSPFGNAPLPYTGPGSGSQGQAGQQLGNNIPASPSVFSPSKSFSEAISASANFAHALRNYFSPEPNSSSHQSSLAATDGLQQTQRLLAQARSNPPTAARLSSTSQPSLPPLQQRSQLFNLPPVKTSRVKSDSVQDVVDAGSALCSVLGARTTIASAPAPVDADKLQSSAQWVDASRQHCLFIAPSAVSTQNTDAALHQTGALEVVASDSDHATQAVVTVEASQLVDCGRSRTLSGDLAAAEPVAPAPAGSAGSRECASVATASRAAKRSAAAASETDASASEEGSEEAEDQLLDEEMEEMEEEEEEEEELQVSGRKRQKTSKAGNKAGKKKVTFYKGKRVVCLNCSAQQTPQWREGPEGPRTLCNACGLRYRKGQPMPYWEVKKKLLGGQ